MDSRWLLLAAAPLSVGCSESVTLGEECPGRLVHCGPYGDAPSHPPGPATTDGGAMAAFPPLDGGMDASVLWPQLVSDAALDATAAVFPADAAWSDAGDALLPAAFPALRNGSFELTRGRPGALAYMVVDPVVIGSSNLAEPWSACRTGFSVVESAESVRGSGIKDVLPREGPGLVEADLGIAGLAGLRQTLETPLLAATRYAFLIDVRASVGAELTLEVWGSQRECVATHKEAEVAPISDKSWQTACVRFTPTVDTPQLILRPTSGNLAADLNARLFFDNLREDPSCR